jgi:alkylhydroperoxidase family enzyme
VKSLSVFDEAQLERIARDYHDAGLTDAEVEMMSFAEQVARDAASMTDDDALRLRAAGFDDQEIVDIAIAAAARVYLGRLLQALAVDVDEPPSLSEPLRAALVAGIRPGPIRNGDATANERMPPHGALHRST